MTITINNTRGKVPYKTLPSTENMYKRKYDGSTPNPKQRVYQRIGAMAKLLKCKQEIIISTMNVRTIREEYKQIELKNNFEYHHIYIYIYILGIQEHRIIHNEKVRYKIFVRIIILTSLALRNDQGSATGGIGIMLNNILRSSLSEMISQIDRILISTSVHSKEILLLLLLSFTHP